jgi:hypothetical protein
MKKSSFKFFLCIIWFSVKSFALDFKEYHLIHNANHCNNYFDYFEQMYQIPRDILRSISIIETGRWQPKLQNYYPWPWTVSNAGKPYYLSSKAEAVKLVRELLQQGHTNIDIGCMQINLHHHPEAFFDLEHAFDPKENISYAAKFLKNHYDRSNNWQQAVAYYHSQSSQGYHYAKKVLKIWSAFSEKKIHPSHCMNEQGNLTPCNKLIQNEVISYSQEREKLPVIAKNDSNKVNSIVSSEKNWKKWRSSMIIYNAK